MPKPVGIVCVEETATAAYALLSSNPTEDSDLAHGAIELLREILVALRISDRYPEMKHSYARRRTACMWICRCVCVRGKPCAKGTNMSIIAHITTLPI